jgi:hypothetical protein
MMRIGKKVRMMRKATLMMRIGIICVIISNIRDNIFASSALC